ncbi:RCCD1 [Cordylochernes scorpioides]|uniref:RCCD1 n=1 Tax=Cordylochernes scorpioides TaxID=51811 RepID=A0ABY6KI98_9ARAC|nr:RCCD1 [Cordylochernes scorpioides]
MKPESIICLLTTYPMQICLCEEGECDVSQNNVTEDEVYCLEESEDKWNLRPIPTDNHQVIQVSCGLSHVLLLTSAGVVLSMGRGSSATAQQLHSSSPRWLKLLKASRWFVLELEDGILWQSQVKAAGPDCWDAHTDVGPDSGDVYVWGWNEAGQLGLPQSIVFQPEPCLLDLPLDFVSVSCGSKHTLLLSGNFIELVVVVKPVSAAEGGEVWGMGSNSYGQLGDLTGSGPISVADQAVGVKCHGFSSCIFFRDHKVSRHN